MSVAKQFLSGVNAGSTSSPATTAKPAVGTDA